MGNKTLREMTGYEGGGYLIPFNNTLQKGCIMSIGKKSGLVVDTIRECH